jgi:peptidoglycan-N-acetylglucosamine deacetylase
MAQCRATDADAAAGTIRVANPHTLLMRWQAIEYIASLHLERRAQAWWGCITTAPGAYSAYRRTWLIQLGGFSNDTYAEDTDLTLTLGRRGCRVTCAPDAVAYTQAPETARGLMRQRVRWLYGNLQSAFKHRAGFFDARTLSLRWYGLPNFWYSYLFVNLLFPLAAVSLAFLPVWVDWRQVAALMGALMGLDIVTAGAALALDNDRQRLWPALVAQRLFYPFFLWAVFVVVAFRAVTGAGDLWHHNEASGSSEKP